MNKLEKAISLTLSDDMYMHNMYSNHDPAKSMEEISKMDDKPPLTEEALNNKKIIYQGSDQEILVNKLRDIRTVLNKKQGENLIMITSVEQESGASFFAKNLAAVMAFDSSKTSLLLDCNISKPSVAKTFDLESSPGLLDYIYKSSVKEEDIILPVGIKRYRCVTAGNIESDSEEYFTHPRFRSLLIGLKNRYPDRNVFIDAPPLLNSANARILLDMCDQVILVAPFGKVDKKKLAAVSRMIPKEKFSGVVINDFI